MQNGQSPGNDKYSEDFYGTFWNYTKKTFLQAVKKAYEIQRLSPSQKQAVINLTEKGRDKDYSKSGEQFIC